ncbi:MAG: branched-chain-amino-acid transaminase [Phycisphaerales bacterium]|nr:branched-chain-amino-acid transaminase [Phycisphaerales bacterium]
MSDQSMLSGAGPLTSESLPITGQVWLNGELMPIEEASVSILDHGLLYGDGCFEGIRVYDGRIFKLRTHLKRMHQSAALLHLDPPYSLDEIERAVRETVAANDITDGYIRLVYTRGVGTLGLNPFTCGTPQAFIIAATISLYPESMYVEGMPIIVASRPRIPIACLDPRIKSLNYLNNILAKVEAIREGVLEALMINCDGEVAECTGDNIFLIKDGRITTPHTDAGILHGVTRQFVIDEVAPALGYEVEQRRVALDEVLAADEMFLTGTAAEIIGVSRVGETVIGTGRVGPETARLNDEFRRRVHQDAPED